VKAPSPFQISSLRISRAFVWRFLIQQSGVANFFHVGQILVTSHGEFVLDEVLAGDDVG